MTQNTIHRLLALVLAAALIACAAPLAPDPDWGDPASIAEAPDPVVISESDGVILAATPLKETVELGEPVYLALRVTNSRQEPITIAGNLRPGDGLIDIFAQGPAGRGATRLAPLSGGDFENSMTLAPGESVGDVVPIFFGADGWNFIESGAYLIHADLHIPDANGYSAFTSEPVVLIVSATAAGQMLFETDQKMRTEAGKFLLWRSGDHLTAGQEHLSAVAKRYPDASLSAYIEAAFIRSFSEPFANYITGKVRSPDCDRAAELRSGLDYEALTDNLIIEDALSQAKCFAEVRRWDEARETLTNAAALADGRPEFAPLARAVAEMQKHLENLPQ